MSKVNVHVLNFFTPNSRKDWVGGDAIVLEWIGDDGTKKFGMMDAGGTMNENLYQQALASGKGDTNTTLWGCVDYGADKKYRDFFASKGITPQNFEWFIVTHFHNDHAWWSKFIVETFKPKAVYAQNPNLYGYPWYAGQRLQVEQSYTWKNFYASNELNTSLHIYCKDNGIPIHDPLTNPSEGGAIMLGDATFRVYNTKALQEAQTVYTPVLNDYNGASLMVSMKHGSKKALFMFDCLPHYSEALIDRIKTDLGGGALDVVHASHHGVANGFSEKVARTTVPKYVIFTSWDRYWDSSYIISDKWQAMGAEMHHNDTNFVENISYQSDGSNISILHNYWATRFAWNTRWVSFSGGDWYYIDESGKVAKWFKVIGGRCYYFDNTGLMKRGWNQVHDGSTGVYWYFMAQNGTTAQYYTSYVFKDGERLFSTWVQTAYGWYWMKADGKMAASESILINGKTYNFGADGICTNP